MYLKASKNVCFQTMKKQWSKGACMAPYSVVGPILSMKSSPLPLILEYDI
jgi:hypothetical protein